MNVKNSNRILFYKKLCGSNFRLSEKSVRFDFLNSFLDEQNNLYSQSYIKQQQRKNNTSNNNNILVSIRTCGNALHNSLIEYRKK